MTGAAGFIGSQLTSALAASGSTVVGVDSFSPYYDVTVKRAAASRLAEMVRAPIHMTGHDRRLAAWS